MTPEQRARVWREIDEIVGRDIPDSDVGAAIAAGFWEPQPPAPSTDYLPRREYRIGQRIGVAILAATALTTIAAYGALMYVGIRYARSLGAF